MRIEMEVWLMGLGSRLWMGMAPVIASEAMLQASLACEVKPFAFVESTIMRRACGVVGQATIRLLYLLQASGQFTCAACVIRMVVLGKPYEGSADIGGRCVSRDA
uniref:hypothetical protein n=1 Tax=Sphingomonas sp. CFBP 13603 TaxID=2774040 RepID=UPI001FD5DF89|nr:hypothetical protein [Sphingomonas sp. CFBP 13603]